MKAVNFILLSFLFSACASSNIEDVVTIKQIEATQSVVLRLNRDESAIFSVLYPLVYKIKKNTTKEIHYFGCSYYFNIENIGSGTGGCHFRKKKGDHSISLIENNDTE